MLSDNNSINLCSWNVNGIRAIAKKGFHGWLDAYGFDIVCLQESKACIEQLEDSLKTYTKYPQVVFNSAERKGYSGVVTLFTKRTEALAVKLGLNHNLFDQQHLKSLNLNIAKAALSVKNYTLQSLEEEIKAFNSEGRVIQSDHHISGLNFTLLNIYFPNGGASDERLDFKLRFYEVFLEYLKILGKQNPNIIITGDFNTAHHPIDLARPDENEETSGFMPVERAYLDRLEEDCGYTDSFRQLHPDTKDKYTWWSYRTAARKRNVGWRIDYFYLSESLASILKSAEIHDEVDGSDHCPVSIVLKIH
jgi:exodeoxyribonuclease-3